MPFDYVLDDISFTNVIMYNRTLPDYSIDRNDKGKKSNGKNLLELADEDWNNYQHH